ncbi:MAG: hypothetical protein JKY65_07800 [Planctomycetes bacterium]|nr:hypothetical protein [Planctomycetota bacterium]
MGAVLRLRLRILRRRYGSPFEAVLLLVVSLLASWLLGKAATKIPTELLSAALSAACLATLGVAIRAGWFLLYRSKELVLLLTQGVERRTLVAARLIELSLGATLLLIPLLAGVRGFHVATVGTEADPFLWLAGLLLGPALAATGLLAACALASLSSGPRRALTVLGVCSLFVLVGVSPGGLQALLLGPLAPGPVLLGLAAGEGRILAPLLIATLALAFSSLALAFRGHEARRDRAAPRTGDRVGSPWLARALRRLLPAPLGALAARDLTLVLRGAAPRAWLILFGLPFALALVPAFAADETIQPWQMRFAVLLLIGIMASASGFLFGVDLPLTRRGCMILERTQPLRGWQVHASRWGCAASYALLLTLGAAIIVARVPRPELALQAGHVLTSGVPLALLVTHHAITFGMRGEAEANPAEASGYPFTGGVVVLGFAFMLAFHWAAAVLYVMVWSGFTRRALVIWERSEVADQPEAAA